MGRTLRAVFVAVGFAFGLASSAKPGDSSQFTATAAKLGVRHL